MTRSSAAHGSPSGPWCAALAALLAAGTAAASGQSQAPPFRSGTDLIAVDVQVVDRNGQPMVGLGADSFEVTVGGRPRRVVSVDLIAYDRARAGAPASEVVGGPGPVAVASPAGPGRVIVLAIDTASFAPGYTRGVLEAARGFVARLQPSDRLGLVAYPGGPEIDPTTNHASVVAALETVTARRFIPVTRYNLSASAVVSISRKIESFSTLDAPSLILQRNPELRDLMLNLCPPNGPDPQDICFKLVANDVRNLVQHFESEASESLGRLRAILDALGRADGRKTLVLLSGGLISSDQAGGRPDLGNVEVMMAQEAARANTAIYTLFVDWKFLERFMAATARLPPSLERISRDSSINSVWLDRFSTMAGGQMFTVAAGNGESAFNRILAETAAYYLLGVEPETADRDGRPHPLGVKVRARGATVRSRSWVALPRTPVPVAAAQHAPAAATRVAPAPISAAPETSAPAAPPPPDPIVPRAAATAGAAAATASPPVDAAADEVTTLPAASTPDAGPPVAVSDGLAALLASAGAYVERFGAAFANVVAEERYVQTATAGADGGPVVPRRELVSDFLLVTLPGTPGWVPFRDVFEVNGSPIRNRDDRLAALFLQPDATSLARAAAILAESATYNIGIQRNMNLPIVALEVMRTTNQPRFRYSSGGRDRTDERVSDVVVFREDRLPTLIAGNGGRNLLMSGRVWIDVATRAIVKTEIAIDDTSMRVSVVTRYEVQPGFSVAIPVEMREEYVEANGRRTTGTASYGRFRRFGVSTSDEMGGVR